MNIKNNTLTAKLMLNKRTLATMGGRAIPGHNGGKSMMTTVMTL